MVRVKRGSCANARRKRILLNTRKFRGASNRLFRTAQQTLTHARAQTHRDRRTKKRWLRRLWISRLNAATRQQGLSYAHFLYLLNQSNIACNRKTLSQLRLLDEQAFYKLIGLVY
uniref:Large ribosomal subunit protein bL20c n=1 Tax=Pseudobryopsis hainanensis TaxID=2320808 RepID=A0A3S7SYE5_9CHLO|nr:ribosomal protein L20 [Pseudobryopsis hainanensis]